MCISILGLEPADPHRAVGSNAFGRHSAAPLLVGRHPGGTQVYASLVGVNGHPIDPDEAATEVRELEVDRRIVVCTVRGGDRLLLQLGRVRPVDRELAGQRITGRVRFARVTPAGESFVLGERGRRIQ
jgi:hypothetical protein